MQRLSIALLQSLVQDVTTAAGLGPLESTTRVTWPKRLASASIRFSGATEGELRIFVTPGSLPHLAADMLGVSPDDPAGAALGEEALSELANVLVGVLLGRWIVASAPYHIGLPELHRVRGLSLAPPASSEGFCSVQFIDPRHHPFAVEVRFTSSH
jgi:hypothetical protein